MEDNMGDFFSTTQQVTTSEYVPLAEGPATFTVTECTRGWHNATAKIPDCPQMELTLSVTDSTNRRGTLRLNLPGHEVMMWKHIELLKSVGLIDDNDKAVNLGELYARIVGRDGECELGKVNWTGRDGQTRTSTEVKRFIPHMSFEQFKRECGV